jgi:hypothetical protein
MVSNINFSIAEQQHFVGFFPYNQYKVDTKFLFVGIYLLVK